MTNSKNTSSDLVERLRAFDYNVDIAMFYDKDPQCVSEAADRIEAQAEEIKAILDREADTYRRHDAKVDALEAENERLRGVLQIITKIRLEGWMSLFGREVRKRIAALGEKS